MLLKVASRRENCKTDKLKQEGFKLRGGEGGYEFKVFIIIFLLCWREVEQIGVTEMEIVRILNQKLTFKKLKCVSNKVAQLKKMRRGIKCDV